MNGGRELWVHVDRPSLVIQFGLEETPRWWLCGMTGETDLERFRDWLLSARPDIVAIVAAVLAARERRPVADILDDGLQDDSEPL